jgi:hypothetical protein
MNFTGPPDRPLPTVDWESEMVIAVVLGSRPSLGYDAYIDLSADPDGLQVTVREERPGPHEPVADAVSHPLLVIAAAARTDGITFRLLEPTARP